MFKALIKLAFRQEIDATATTAFEKDVFNDSYQEFLLQAQAYNRDGNFHTLREMIDHNPKANSLHYKTGFAVALYIAALKGTIPGIRSVIPGTMQPAFESHDFEILYSDISDKAKHRVAITYYTGVLTWLDSFGGKILLAAGDLSHPSQGEWIDTFMVEPSASTIIWQYSPFQS